MATVFFFSGWKTQKKTRKKVKENGNRRRRRRRRRRGSRSLLLFCPSSCLSTVAFECINYSTFSHTTRPRPVGDAGDARDARDAGHVGSLVKASLRRPSASVSPGRSVGLRMPRMPGMLQMLRMLGMLRMLREAGEAAELELWGISEMPEDVQRSLGC